MHASRAVLKHTPLIHFLGKRTIPKNIDHTPHVHPLSGMTQLPKSFFGGAGAGGAGSAAATESASSPGALDSVLDLPQRFKMPAISEEELEQVNSGAAEFIY